MVLSNPLSDVIPGARGELLAVLVRLEQPVSRRSLAEMAGVAAGNASSVIEDLIALGVVSETVAGRSSMVSLNRRSLVSQHLLGLAGLRSQFIDSLSALVGSSDLVVGAWLFGSVARGDAEAGSDVDVLVVAKDLESDEFKSLLGELYESVQAWVGAELQVVEHTPESFAKLVERSNPLVANVRSEGVVLVESDLLGVGHG